LYVNSATIEDRMELMSSGNAKLTWTTPSGNVISYEKHINENLCLDFKLGLSLLKKGALHVSIASTFMPRLFYTKAFCIAFLK